MSDNFPDHIIVDIEVNSHGDLLKVDAPLGAWPNGQPPWWTMAGGGVCIATFLAQTFKYPAASTLQTNPAQNGKLNTLGSYGHTFVYMDCGRWGGPTPRFNSVHRDFGLIHGRYVALCEYVADGGLNLQDNLFKSDDGYERATLINDFIRAVYSAGGCIRLIKTLLSTTHPTLVEPDKSKVYLVIPDMHLPVNIKPTPAADIGDGAHWGRHQYRDIGADTAGFYEIAGHRRLCGSAQRWFRQYNATNIFGAPSDAGGAREHLLKFLDVIAKTSVKSQVHFVHVGDMYDFWIGLDRYFKAPDSGVSLLTDNLGIKTTDFLDHWATVTHDLWGDMIDQMHDLPTGKKTFLWGNHDNYLSKYLPLRPPHKLAIPDRTREVRTGGIYIEHGQRVDPENKDGVENGINTTNLVFEGKIPYCFDPNRRNYYTAGSAAAYCGNPDFAVYVMGHTHERYLTNVWPVIHVK
jgi:hypothetical protein